MAYLQNKDSDRVLVVGRKNIEVIKLTNEVDSGYLYCRPGIRPCFRVHGNSVCGVRAEDMT